MSRLSVKNLEWYIGLYNGKAKYPISLDIAYGGYKLITHDMHELVPYRMSCRECYYVLLGMYNAKIDEMREDTSC